jgi:hypothetical protein
MVPESCSCLTPCSSAATMYPGQDGEHRPVHGHGDAHLVQGDLVEEHFHVFHRVDGHAGLADIPHDPGVVRIVAAVGGQVEGHGKPFWPAARLRR